MALTATEAGIRDFLVTEIFYDKDIGDLGVTDSLIQGGLLDSLAILRIVAFCEENFGIEIPDQELLPEHFENIRAIAKLVEARLAGG
jgi:acyl carrier protein